jgi:pilus assembly protein CpaC
MSGLVPGRGLPKVLKRFSVFVAAMLVAIAAMAGAGEALAGASDYQSQIMAGSGQTSRTVKLGLNKSLIVELPRDARDVLVSNPAIADAVIRSSRRIYLTGVAVGETSIFVFDRDDQLIVNLSLEVERDISGLEQKLNALIQGARISVDLFNDNIVLSGTVKNASDSRRAIDLANAFANGGRNSQAQQDRSSGGATAGGTTVNVGSTQTDRTSSVINMLTIEGEDQVHLKVTIAEVNRNAVKQLGVDWDLTNVGGILTAVLQNAFPVNSTSPGSVTLSSGGVDATVNLLEQEGLYRTLAEPTLTAISGESASFLAGGEFPVVTGVDNNGTPSVQFKPFGVGLDFTPVVLSDGRISLRVRTEVSELSQDGALRVGSAVLPGLKVRRAETTLELPSGGSMIMGGLLQDNIRQALSGQPGLMKLPVLGTLFRSRDYQRSETELVIMVTPYLVAPTSVSSLARPDDGLNAPSDAAANFLGRLNRMYGNQGKPAPQGSYRGRFGFIYE